MHCKAGQLLYLCVALKGRHYLQVFAMHAFLSFESHLHCRRRAAGQGIDRAEELADILRPLADVLRRRSAATSNMVDGLATAVQPSGSNDGALPHLSDSTHGRGRGAAAAASKAATQAAGIMEEGQNLPGVDAIGRGGVTTQLCDSEDEGTEGQEGLPRLPRRRNNAVIASSSSEDELPLGLQRQPRSTGEAAGSSMPMRLKCWYKDHLTH